MSSVQPPESGEKPATIELTRVDGNGTRHQVSSGPPLSTPLLDQKPSSSAVAPPLLGGTAELVGSAVVFVVAQAWKLIDASKQVKVSNTAPQGSAVILEGTEASEYTGGQSWASDWYEVTLKNSLSTTTTSLRFRIRASTHARPPQRTPPLRDGLYIPNLVVDTDQFFQNIFQTVDVGVSLTAWEARPPLDPAVDPGLCVAYVELTVTVSSSFLAEWSRSFTFAIRGDQASAEAIQSKVVPA